MDLVRQLLLRIEASAPKDQPEKVLQAPGYTDEQIVYHVKIMADRGLVVATVADITTKDSGGRKEYAIFALGDLTWEGQDFLDLVRSETVWNKTMEKVKATAGTTTLEMFKEIASGIAKTVILGAP